MKIGVLSESFRLPMLQAVDRAAALGLDGLQIYAVGRNWIADGAPPARCANCAII